MVSLTSKNPILTKYVIASIKKWREMRTNFALHTVTVHIFNVKNNCVCVNEKICHPKFNKDVYIEAIHATHTGSWIMTDMAIHAWWLYIYCDLLSKTAECNTWVNIGKNLKSIIPSTKWATLKLCKVPNKEIKNNFGGPNYNEKDQELNFLAC